jgi:formate hydrogenlyase subunit 3/multisubunit Na+/H+ antiporter MnhD subunit
MIFHIAHEYSTPNSVFRRVYGVCYDTLDFEAKGPGEVCLTLLPIISTLLGALILGRLRGRSQRIQWGTALGVALVTWLISLGLVLARSTSTQLSLWQPEELFASQLELSLDSLSWLAVYAIATVLLSIVMTSATRPDGSPVSSRLVMLVYTSLAMIAVMAGNVLTIIIAWALLDSLTFVLLVLVWPQEMEVSALLIRFTVDTTSLFLALGAMLVNAIAGGEATLDAPLASSSAVILLSLACLFRLGLLPLHFSLPSLPKIRVGVGTLIRLVPPATALVVLARLYDLGLPESALLWLRIGGIAGILIGGARWVLAENNLEARPYLVLVVSGLGVLAGTQSGGLSTPLIGAAVTLLLAGVVLSLGEIYSQTHRIWVALAVVMLAGAPATPAGAIAGSLMTFPLDPSQFLLIPFGIIGFLVAGLGAIRGVTQESVAWQSSESLARFMYTVGLVLPSAVGLGAGMIIGQNLDLSAIIVFALVLAVGGAMYYLTVRRGNRAWIEWLDVARRLDPGQVYRWLGVLYRWLTDLFRRLAGIFEGEGGFLWMFVILMLALLAVGGLGQ